LGRKKRGKKEKQPKSWQP